MEEGALLSPIALGVFVCGGLARFHLAGNGVDGCIPAHLIRLGGEAGGSSRPIV